VKSYITSYNAMFTRRAPDAPTVERIEIPLIQRDYAQGREGGAVARIRASFLDVLHGALTSNIPVSLDFVYGDVIDGTLRPLDGQQRLTTLFLLHWYLAVRADRLDEEHGWKQFTYATRPSARLFCQRLAACRPDAVADDLASWIEDQSWFLHTWRHDPSIRSMLVMLDAIHRRFKADDCLAAWGRLVHPGAPAISFHLLPIEQMGLSEDLYIKMNSRGKPLTAFENFKARFEQVLEDSCPDRVEEFALKVDGAWSDLLWPYRGSDSIIDDEFLRYFQFVTEVCEWRRGNAPAGEIAVLAESVYGPSNPHAAEHLDFLFQALDTWVDADVASTFADVFTVASAANDAEDVSKVVLFGTHSGVDLFAACCEQYGEVRGRNRVFGASETLFLYAVLLHRLHKTTEFARRLRVLRNLVEASSGNELRFEKMPGLLADVGRIIVEGTLDGVTAFNQAQVADERLKAAFLEEHPELTPTLLRLEDHHLLRGCLAAFELDASVFEQRARAFHKIFADSSDLPSLTGALLATGDYSRRLDPRSFQFGSSWTHAPWRDLLTGAARPQLATTREVLGRVLDAIVHAVTVREGLDSITNQWLATKVEAEGLDWRWYFVKYKVMREGSSGIYVGSTGAIGYRLCMMRKRQMNSNYRDPFLLAVYRESGVTAALEDPWFTGYETEPRWMGLLKSGAEIQCVTHGFALRPPKDAAEAATFARVCAKHGVGDDLVLSIPQTVRDSCSVDTSDRVQLAAAFVRELVEAGL